MVANEQVVTVRRSARLWTHTFMLFRAKSRSSQYAIPIQYLIPANMPFQANRTNSSRFGTLFTLWTQTQPLLDIKDFRETVTVRNRRSDR